MNLHFEWKRLESLTALELYHIIQARESVFVVEQQCAYQEADGLDLHAWHLRVLLEGELAACARVVDPGRKYTEPSIGRVMTLGNFRKLQIGRALVAEAIAFTERQWPGQGIRIGAQAHLQHFYGSLGFQTVGDVYDEDGIPHVDMVKPAPI
ncbi:MAG: GNAT family N-acetyltransferase [Acidovorax sp.]|jgi:ElaA protein|nr:GNAT family N-acetyltransferase [Acidovorax sp.]